MIARGVLWKVIATGNNFTGFEGYSFSWLGGLDAAAVREGRFDFKVEITRIIFTVNRASGFSVRHRLQPLDQQNRNGDNHLSWHPR